MVTVTESSNRVSTSYYTDRCRSSVWSSSTCCMLCGKFMSMRRNSRFLSGPACEPMTATAADVTPCARAIERWMLRRRRLSWTNLSCSLNTFNHSLVYHHLDLLHCRQITTATVNSHMRYTRHELYSTQMEETAIVLTYTQNDRPLKDRVIHC